MGVLERVHRGASPVGIFTDNSYKQAWGLLSGTTPGAAGLPPTRGTAEYLRAYSQMPWLRAVTGRISTAVARVEWQLFVSKGKNDAKAKAAPHIQHAFDKVYRRQLLKQAKEADELKQVLEHPMLDVLRNANEFQTGYSLRKVTQLHIDLVGEAFWLKERDAQGTVVGVWPIPPNWIMATPTPAFRFFRVNYRAWKGIIPDTEFLWFADVDPLNPYGRGTGAAMSLGDELETDEYAARHTKAFFYNQARPDMLVWPKGQGMTDANVKRLEDDWVSKSQGFWKAFKPYFLTREVEVKQLDQNLRAQQFVQLREFERDIILQHYGVPPEVLGVLEHSNRSTIDAADFLMARYVMEPRLEFLRTTLQERFVPEYDERLIVEYVDPAVEDRAQQLAAATAAPWAMTVDEWRAMQGQPPLEDKEAGALHFVLNTGAFEVVEVKPDPPPMPLLPPGAPGAPRPPGGNGQPGDVPNNEPMPTTPGEGRRAFALNGESLNGSETLVGAAVMAAVDAGDVALADSLTRADAWKATGKLPAASMVAARQEAALVRSLVRTWTDHATRINLQAVVDAIGPAGVHGDVVPLLDYETLNSAQEDVLVQALRRGMLRGIEVGRQALSEARQRGAKAGPLTLDLSGTHAAAEAWAKQHAADLAQLPAAQKQRVKELVESSIAEGTPPMELAKLIRDTIGLTDRQADAVANFRDRLVDQEVAEAERVSRVERYARAQRTYRAQTIARTELLGSLNAGQQELWDEAVAQHVIEPGEMEKIWIVTDDDLLEEECEAMADEQVAIDDQFSSGDDFPPAHPNCRCTIGLVDAAGKAMRQQRAGTGADGGVPVIHIHNNIAPPAVRRRIERDTHGRPSGIVDEPVESVE